MKKSRLQRDSNPWPPRYRCDALPTELWSHTLGARPIYWVHISREEWNDVKYKFTAMIILHFDLQPQFKYMNYFMYTSHHFTPHGRYELNKLASLPMCGFIAQLVEHRTGIAEVTGSNLVEALIFFRLLLSNCLNWKIYCDDHSSLWSRSRVRIPLKPWFFQASSFQLLKLENLLRWSFFTLIYNRSSNIWIISYILHISNSIVSHKQLCSKISSITKEEL